jgi:general secretion pathway protein L
MNLLNSTALAPLRAQLERLLGQWRGSPAQRLWRLWLSELNGLLPARWRERLGSGPQIGTLDWPLAEPPIAPDNGSLRNLPHHPVARGLAPDTADQPTDENLTPRLGSKPPHHTGAPPIAAHPGLAGARHILLLPANTVLIQHLTVPLLATRNLREVLGFELDKHTPFNAAQLYFDARVISRDKHQAKVVLVAILRERLQTILDHCQQRGLTLHAVDVRDSHGALLDIDLLPSHARPGQRAGNRLNRWLLTICAVLLLGCMLLWLNTRQTLLDDMQNSVAEQRQHVAQLQRLRAELLNTRGAARYLAQRKLAQPALTQVLADLSDCLGADTWLEQLEVSDSGEVTLSGQSASASDLINRVKGCHSLVDAQFQGIIQPDADSGKDHFSLRAHLRKEAADAPSA